MNETHNAGLTGFYDTHPINEFEILAKVEASGVRMEALTEADLEAFDQDHYGGTPVLDTLADAAGIAAQHHVLDVCSGMGGPARWLAHHRGCRVTGIDLTRSRVESARRLTERVKLAHLVDFVDGDATAMPLPDAQYDVVISQESWLHVPDKAAVISECVRVLKPGGILAFTDIVVLTSLDEATQARLGAGMHTANLASITQYQSLLRANGCSVQRTDDLSSDWRDVLVERLAMYRSLRDTTVTQFGEARYLEYDDVYSHFVDCFINGILGGARLVARTADTPELSRGP